MKIILFNIIYADLKILFQMFRKSDCCNSTVVFCVKFLVVVNFG